MIMMLKPNILALSLLLPVLVSVFLGVNAWRPRYAPRGKTFGLLMFALAIWSAAYGLELASTDFISMIFWLRIEYIGIPYISALMVLVIIQFVGINFSISKKQILPKLSDSSFHLPQSQRLFQNFPFLCGIKPIGV